MLTLKYSLNIQKAESLTWEQNRLPAPIDSTIRFGSTPPPATTGARMPAAVRPATVADPTHTRITAVTIQASSSGSIESPCSACAIWALTPLLMSTSLKAPEPAITSRIEATSLMALPNVFITTGRDRPRTSPSDTVAKTSAMIITTSGSERNRSRPDSGTPPWAAVGTRNPLTVVSRSRTAGSSAVRMLMNVPGSSLSGFGSAAKPGRGRAWIPASVRANTGPARMMAGTATINP